MSIKGVIQHTCLDLLINILWPDPSLIQYLFTSKLSLNMYMTDTHDSYILLEVVSRNMLLDLSYCRIQ